MLPGLALAGKHAYHVTGLEVTPTMTAPTTPAGYTASASTEFDTTYVAWKAFDGAFADSSWNSSAAGLPQWLQLQFPSAVYVASYKITSRPAGGETYAPGSFTLQGSNDGTNWTVVDTRTGQVFAVSETKTYTVAIPQPFVYWRLNITATPNGTYAGLTELELYG